MPLYWQRQESECAPVSMIMDVDYTDDTELLANTSTQAQSLLHNLEQAAGGIGLHVTDKTEFMCFNQRGDISTLNGRSLKLADKSIHLRSSISSTENNNTLLAKERKLDGNCTRMLRAVLNKSWRQHLTKQQLHGHLPFILKTIQIRWTKHARHCWRSKDEFISDILLWTPPLIWMSKSRPNS